DEEPITAREQASDDDGEGIGDTETHVRGAHRLRQKPGGLEPDDAGGDAQWPLGGDPDRPDDLRRPFLDLRAERCNPMLRGPWVQETLTYVAGLVYGEGL